MSYFKVLSEPRKHRNILYSYQLEKYSLDMAHIIYKKQHPVNTTQRQERVHYGGRPFKSLYAYRERETKLQRELKSIAWHIGVDFNVVFLLLIPI